MATRGLLAIAATVVLMAIALFQVYQPVPFDKHANQLQLFEYGQLHMGMPVTLTVWTESRDKAERTCGLAFERIAELERIFSDYDRTSEVSRLNRSPLNQPIPVSGELMELLVFSQQLHRQSSGAFDPAVGQLTQLWRQSKRSGQAPDEQTLQQARSNSGLELLELDVAHQTVTRLADVWLDFGSVAKGYIGDQAIGILRSQGLRIACYEAGGDIVCGDAPPGAAGWAIDLDQAGPVLAANQGVAISGDTQQFFERDGKRFSHVIDITSGEGSTRRGMAAVVAQRGMHSDALATTGSLLEADVFQALLQEYQPCRGWSWEPVEALQAQAAATDPASNQESIPAGPELIPTGNRRQHPQE